MYTGIDVFPGRRPRWVADEALLLKLAAHLRASGVRMMRGFSAPQYWDIDNDSRLFLKKGLSIDEALTIWRTECPVCTRMNWKAETWSHAVWESLKDYAEEATYERFVPADIFVTLGPTSVPDQFMERTIARCRFVLSLSGDGMPKDLDEYLRVVSKNEHFVALMDFLRKTSGFDWRMTISSSF